MNHWKLFSGLLGTVILLTGCSKGEPPAGKSPQTSSVNDQSKDTGMNAGNEFQLAIQSEPYGTTADGQEITQFLLSNEKGTSINIINYGAIVTSIFLPDREGKSENITLGFNTLAEYEKKVPTLERSVVDMRIGLQMGNLILKVKNINWLRILLPAIYTEEIRALTRKSGLQKVIRIKMKLVSV